MKETCARLRYREKGGTTSERTGLRRSKKMICELDLNSGEDIALEKPQEELPRQMEQHEFRPGTGKSMVCLRN